MIGQLAPVREVAIRDPDIGGLRHLFMQPPPRTVPICHPDEEHFSEQLCRSCFWRLYRQERR